MNEHWQENGTRMKHYFKDKKRKSLEIREHQKETTHKINPYGSTRKNCIYMVTPKPLMVKIKFGVAT